MSAYIKYQPISLGGGGGNTGIISINADSTSAQLLTVGTAGSDFHIVDAGSGSHVFDLPTASATNRGALSSADWSTFNNKQAALSFGNLTDGGTDGITVTGGTGAVVGSGTSLSQHVADTTHNGYLSSTDWNIFNGKQPTITIGAIDAQSANATGLALVSNVLSTQSADATHPGLINLTTQTWTGVKTFASGWAAQAQSFVTGTSDQVQLYVKGNGTQTTDIFQVIKSDNTVLGRVSNAGLLTIQNIIDAGTSAHGVVTTNSSNQMQSVAPGSSGNVLTSNGTDWTSATPTSSGTVTSVTFTGDGTVLSSTPSSAVTTSGTLTAALASQSGNKFIASPADGSSGSLSARVIAPADFGVATVNSAVAINLGLACSVSANALTIALKQNDGSTDPATGTGAVKIAYRSSTATSGGYTLVSTTAATSIVVPSSATLGQTSAMNQYIWVYAINNAGTTELAVSGVEVTLDNSIVSTTTISGSATSGSVLYSPTGRSSVSARLIGRLLVNEATAGTWASAPSDVVTMPVPQFTATETSATYSFVPNTTAFGAGTTGQVYKSYRRGDRLYAEVFFQVGTVTANIAKIAMPSGLTIDSSKMNSTGFTKIGDGYVTIASGTPSNIYSGGNAFIAAYDGSDTSSIYMPFTVASSGTIKGLANALLASSQFIAMKFDIPVTGWSIYGP